MTILRDTISRNTRLACSWTPAEVAAIADVTVIAAIRFCSSLARAGVLIESEPGRYVAGPKADEWRCVKTATREGGNSAKYLQAKKVRDELATRDWEVRTGKRREEVDLTISREDKLRQSGQEADIEMKKGTLTVAEYAQFMGWSTKTVIRRIRSGAIPTLNHGVRSYRIPITHLAEVVNVAAQTKI